MATTVQLAEQVQLLLNQVQHLNGQTDQQAQILLEMADYQQIKAELINLKNQMNTGAGRTQDQNKYLINIKDVKIENFSGEGSKFPART